MKIDVHDATLKTATVEIKSLTVSGKQVTLAVFRQLQEEDALARDGHGTATTKGPIWGRVNYHPDMSCKRSHKGEWQHPHIHVVWQRGDELRRSRIDVAELRTPERARIYLEHGSDWLRGAWSQGWRPTAWQPHAHLPDELLVGIDDLLAEIYVPQDVRTAASCWHNAPCDCLGKIQLPESEVTTEDLVAEAREVISARRANIQMADAIEALPQLFIAI